MKVPLASCLLPCARRHLRGPLLALLACAASSLRAAPVQTQTFNLQAGWNAVFLEVIPTNSRPQAVFGGLPLEIAWTFRTRLTSVDYIQDPTEPVWNADRWDFFAPTNRVESRFNRLFSVGGHRAYLLRLTNAATWTVTGVPGATLIKWAPDAYNLVGLPIDPAAPPTFQTFFRPSPAHYVTNTGQLRAVYRLGANGAWTLVTPTTVTKSGEAYWFFCKGASDYQGPLDLRLEAGGAIDYGAVLDSTTLRLGNRSTAIANVTISDLLTAGSPLLSYQQFDSTRGFTWNALPNPLTLVAAAGTNRVVRLAIARPQMAGRTFETVLSVNNGAGVRWLVPVTASRNFGIAGSGGAAGQGRAKTPADDARANAGLWIGTATITAVSEAHSGQLVTNGFLSIPPVDFGGISGVSNPPISITRTNISLTPTPVKSPFDLRVIIHVDTNGTARLLKEVIQMWQDGTMTNDMNGNAVTAVPGRYVLLTEESLIPNFKGAILRDNDLIGRRFSTTMFDFPATPGNNFLPLSGAFAIDSSVGATINLPATFPTNPFRHKYHPDHDNLNARFQDFREEAYPVTREIALSFLPPATNAPPDYGYGLLSGAYTEVVTGLHKTNIVAAGAFTLRRVTEVGVLNQ